MHNVKYISVNVLCTVTNRIVGLTITLTISPPPSPPHPVLMLISRIQ